MRSTSGHLKVSSSLIPTFNLISAPTDAPAMETRKTEGQRGAAFWDYAAQVIVNIQDREVSAPTGG